MASKPRKAQPEPAPIDLATARPPEIDAQARAIDEARTALAAAGEAVAAAQAGDPPDETALAAAEAELAEAKARLEALIGVDFGAEPPAAPADPEPPVLEPDPQPPQEAALLATIVPAEGPIEFVEAAGGAGHAAEPESHREGTPPDNADVPELVAAVAVEGLRWRGRSFEPGEAIEPPLERARFERLEREGVVRRA